MFPELLEVLRGLERLNPRPTPLDLSQLRAESLDNGSADKRITL